LVGGAFPDREVQWPVPPAHPPTVAGAAPELRRGVHAAHRLPVSPAPRAAARTPARRASV